MKKAFSLILILCLLLTGCTDVSDSDSSSGNPDPTSAAAEADFSQTDEDMFTARDQNAEYSNSTLIQLNGDSISCSDPSVTISATTATITDEGTYVISGTLDDGMIIVDTEETDKPQIVLSGASITNQTSAALYIREADKVFVTLADGTSNTLSSGEDFIAIDDNNIDGAVYSKQDLTFNGSGSLTVTSPAGHGIVCKDDLIFTGGIYTIASASHGLDANDSVRITNTSMTIDAGKDGIHVENSDDAALGFLYISSGTITVEAEGDGMSSSYYTQICGGTIDLLCGGGYENGTKSDSGSYGDFMGGGGMGGGGMGGSRPRSSTSPSSSINDSGTSMKGIKSGSGILVSGGTITIDSADDSVHGAGDVMINGGAWNISSGDDGLHSDATLTITACDMTIHEAYEGIEGAYIYIQGGTVWMNCSDDGLNAAGGVDSSGSSNRDGGFGGGMGSSDYGYIEISGGTLTIYSCGDGLDSNGDLLISGGYTYVTNPRSGDVSVLDSQNSPVITGGTYIGLGISSMMVQTFSAASSTQAVIACTCGTQAAGSALTVTDSKGNEILSLTTEYSTYLLIISTPEIVSGASYDISIGTVSGTVEAS